MKVEVIPDLSDPKEAEELRKDLEKEYEEFQKSQEDSGNLEAPEGIGAMVVEGIAEIGGISFMVYLTLLFLTTVSTMIVLEAQVDRFSGFGANLAKVLLPILSMVLFFLFLLEKGRKSKGDMVLLSNKKKRIDKLKTVVAKDYHVTMGLQRKAVETRKSLGPMIKDVEDRVSAITKSSQTFKERGLTLVSGEVEGAAKRIDEFLTTVGMNFMPKELVNFSKRWMELMPEAQYPVESMVTLFRGLFCGGSSTLERRIQEDFKSFTSILLLPASRLQRSCQQVHRLTSLSQQRAWQRLIWTM